MKILATLDGSPESTAVLPTLIKLARQAKASVTLFSVAQPAQATARREARLDMVTPGGQMGATAPIPVVRPESVLNPPERRWVETKAQALERSKTEAHDYLEDAAIALRNAGIEVGEEVALGEDPAEEIIAFAGDGNYDLIAMATHGRTGLRELVQGSVAAAVVKSGVAPVLLVRPKP